MRQGFLNWATAHFVLPRPEPPWTSSARRSTGGGSAKLSFAYRCLNCFALTLENSSRSALMSETLRGRTCQAIHASNTDDAETTSFITARVKSNSGGSSYSCEMGAVKAILPVVMSNLRPGW